MPQHKLRELDVDLAQIREVKRLLTRGLKKLKAIEKHVLFKRKLDRQSVPTVEERAAVEDLYGVE